MPEAFVVAAARTPIGRAVKGSLKDVRTDDLAVAAVRAVLDQVPTFDPADLDDLYLGCAEPWAEQGSNLARVVTVLLGLDGFPGATVNRFCSSSVQTTDGVPRHQGRGGRGVRERGGRVRLAVPLRDARGQHERGVAEPGVRRGPHADGGRGVHCRPPFASAAR